MARGSVQSSTQGREDSTLTENEVAEVHEDDLSIGEMIIIQQLMQIEQYLRDLCEGGDDGVRH